MADNQSLFPVEGLLNFKRDTYEDTVSNKYPLGGLLTDMWAEGKLPFVASPRGLPSTGLLWMMSQDSDYRGQHSAPTNDGYSKPLHDASEMMPDIYHPEGYRYHGDHGGNASDKEAQRLFLESYDDPDKEVTIYRAVPEEAGENINAGDWVTPFYDYAVQHIGDEENWKIISEKVKAKDLYTDGNSIYEFGYDPN